jgi:pilus assembly protein CpaD
MSSKNMKLPVAGKALVAAFAVSLLAGCGNMHRDSITVGAVPDDYRTNHPIVVGEKARRIDIPVGATQHALAQTQEVAVRGFLHTYDRTARPAVTMLVPHGSVNQHSASIVADGIVRVMQSEGVGEGHIIRQHYQADASSEAPIRLTYSTLQASVGQCGRWDKDLLDNPENRHYTNFGCAYQNNLAAQIADPADLLGPRKPTPIDAQNRQNAIEDYQARVVTDFVRTNREVNY